MAIQPLQLTGKRIVITGAASGIGLGAAKVLADLGADVCVADLDLGQLKSAFPGLGHDRLLVCDVVDEDACEALMSGAETAMGGIDGVLHSAGISDAVVEAVDARLSDWQRVIDVNLRGTFLVCRAAGRRMLSQGQGSIVNISSVNGMNGIPRRHAYGPAKAAVAQLTRTLACEWGARKVRVNALAPTYVRTPMVERLAAEGKIDVGALERRTPLARLGEVEDVGLAAAFLLSDWSQFVTGVVLPVDGGWLAYGGPGDVTSA